MLHRIPRYVSNAAISRGRGHSAAFHFQVRRSPRARSPRLALTARAGCGSARTHDESKRFGRRSTPRIRHGRPLRDRAVRPRPRGEGDRRSQGGSRALRCAGRAKAPISTGWCAARSFSADEQLQALSAVLERAGIGGLAAKFLKLVTANRRLFAVRDMVKAFRALVADHKGEATARGHGRRAAQGRTPRRAAQRPQGGQRQGCRPRRHDRSRHHRRARGQARQPHGRQLAPHQAQFASSTR